MALPQIYADFQNADPAGRVRLNCAGTIADLSRAQLRLHEGLAVLLYADDADETGRTQRLVVEGVATYSPDEHCWVATIDWQKIRHASECQTENVTDRPRGAILPGSQVVPEPRSGPSVA